MGFKSGVTKVIKPFINVKGWLGYREIKESSFYFVGLVRNIFSLTKKKGEDESFNEAVARMRLSEAALKHQYNAYLQQSVIYLVASILGLGYVFYLLTLSAFFPALMAFLIVLLGFLITFRAYFWAYQIKRKKLGCTFKECFYSLLANTKDS